MVVTTSVDERASVDPEGADRCSLEKSKETEGKRKTPRAYIRTTVQRMSRLLRPIRGFRTNC